MLIKLSHTCKSISGRTISYRIWHMIVQGVMWFRMGMIETDGYPSNWLDSYPQASEGACALGRILPPALPRSQGWARRYPRFKPGFSARHGATPRSGLRVCIYIVALRGTLTTLTLLHHSHGSPSHQCICKQSHFIFKFSTRCRSGKRRVKSTRWTNEESRWTHPSQIRLFKSIILASWGSIQQMLSSTSTSRKKSGN